MSGVSVPPPAAPTAPTRSSAPEARTVGQLRASGHRARPLRVEIRENLLAALAAGRDPWPGLHGFGSTVIPQLERALDRGPRRGAPR